jgi:hypothetical protein
MRLFGLGVVTGLFGAALWAMWPELRSEAQWVGWGR